MANGERTDSVKLQVLSELALARAGFDCDLESLNDLYHLYWVQWASGLAHTRTNTNIETDIAFGILPEFVTSELGACPWTYHAFALSAMHAAAIGYRSKNGVLPTVNAIYAGRLMDGNHLDAQKLKAMYDLFAAANRKSVTQYTKGFSDRKSLRKWFQSGKGFLLAP